MLPALEDDMANPLVHFEFMTDDDERCREFYESVFDWSVNTTGAPGYAQLSPGFGPGGGILRRPPEMPQSGLTIYFQVDDVNATLARACAAGGHILMPRTPIPNMGAFAIFSDPDRNRIGLLEGGPAGEMADTDIPPEG